MADVYVLKDTRVGVAEQLVWGTAYADASAVAELELTEPPTIEWDVKERMQQTLGGARELIDGNLMHDTKGSMCRFTLQGPVKITEIDLFLYSIFQNGTFGSSGVYLKTFTFGTTQPDFATSNAGATLTFFFRGYSPAASPASWKVKDCICESLEFTVNPTDGRLSYTASFVGRGVPATSTPSGTWTPGATDKYKYYHDLGGTSGRVSINWGGGALACLIGEAKIKISQDISTVGHSDGSFDNYALSNKQVVVTVQVLRDANTYTAFASSQANTAATFRLGWGTAGAATDGDFDFSVRGILKPPKFTTVNEGVLAYDIELHQSRASSTLAAATTVILANSVNRSW